MKIAAIAIAAAALFVTPAVAIEINLMVPLTDQAGTPQQDCDHVDTTKQVCDKYVTLTLGRLAAAAVDLIDPSLKPSEIRQHGDLVLKIRRVMLSPAAHGKADLTPAELDMIEAQIPKLRVAPSTVSQAVELLHPPVTK
jgi:hypothetical protein